MLVMNVLLPLFYFFNLKSSLLLEVKNASPNSDIRVGIYNKEDGFLDTKKVAYYKEFVSDAKGNATVSLDKMPFGEYAIAVFQDNNHNKKLDTNIFGYPNEPFGFSNDFRPKLKAPTFAQCKFNFQKEGQIIRIQLLK
ncbi:MAG: DUF2141 domain-containing protein [Leadbetterella sp.]